MTVLADSETSVIVVLVLDDPSQATTIGQIVLEAGLRLVEVTFRTPEAEKALEALACVTGLTVGAGTVLSVDQAQSAVQVGAKFVVSPGLDPAVVSRCQDLGVEIFPGTVTASEIQQALTLGVDIVKFFPAEAMGGINTIDALSAPFPDVRFIPTGGITQDNAPRYLSHQAVAAVGGSWMFPRELLARRDWSAISRLAREAALLIPGMNHEGQRKAT